MGQARSQSTQTYKPQSSARNANNKKNAEMSKKQRPLLVEIFGVLPPIYKGVLIGLALSIIPVIVVSSSPTENSNLLVILIPLLFMGVGLSVGAVLSRRS